MPSMPRISSRNGNNVAFHEIETGECMTVRKGPGDPSGLMLIQTAVPIALARDFGVCQTARSSKWLDETLPFGPAKISVVPASKYTS